MSWIEKLRGYWTKLGLKDSFWKQLKDKSYHTLDTQYGNSAISGKDPSTEQHQNIEERDSLERIG